MLSVHIKCNWYKTEEKKNCGQKFIKNVHTNLLKNSVLLSIIEFVMKMFIIKIH